MKTHTNGYKNAIKVLGREIDGKITYTLNNVEIVLDSNNINSISPHYEGAILKSVMKQLDLDIDRDIPLNTILNAQFGVKVNGTYEYLDLGNYVVYKTEKQEDLGSYKITCYDKMLYSMKAYKTPKLNNVAITYPITIKNYIKAICETIGLDFASENDDFTNHNKLIQNELYLDEEGGSLNYTFRDVLDELAEVTASTICINDDDELEIRYIKDNDTLPSDYTQVEYIESTGTQYIDTGIKMNNSIKLDITAQIGELSNNNPLVASNMGSSVNSFGIYLRITNASSRYTAGTNWSNYVDSAWNDQVRHIIYDNDNFILDGTTLSVTQQEYETERNLEIFRSYNENRYGKYKLYSMKMYENGILLRNFVPCYRNSDNEVGLYDLVNDVFYTNQGTGAFEYGNKTRLPIDYTRVDYIQNTSGAYIDTGYAPDSTNGFKIEVKYTPTIANERYCVLSNYSRAGHTSLEIYSSNKSRVYINNGQVDNRNNTILSTTDINNVVVEYSNGALRHIVNGTETDISSTLTLGDASLYMFLDRSKRVSTFTEPLRIYECKLYNGGTLVRYFVPCYRNSDGVIGMYDLKNNVFYPNEGTGSFSYGNVIQNDIIDEEYFKDINVNFGEKYGPINTIILSRNEVDNISQSTPSNLEDSKKKAIKIVDNQIMNFDDRDEYLTEILKRLNGLNYYINDFASTGIVYYNICDRYNAKIDDKIYSCVMFNDEVNITQGLVENIYTEMPEETEEEYKYMTSTDKGINQAYLKLNKQNQTFEAMLSQATTDLEGNLDKKYNRIFIDKDTFEIEQGQRQAIDNQINGSGGLKDQINNNGQELNSVKKFFRYEDGIVKLGEANSNFQLELEGGENGEIRFMGNGIKLGYFNKERLYVENTTVFNEQVIAKKGDEEAVNYYWHVTDDGCLDLDYGGTEE